MIKELNLLYTDKEIKYCKMPILSSSICLNYTSCEENWLN